MLFRIFRTLSRNFTVVKYVSRTQLYLTYLGKCKELILFLVTIFQKMDLSNFKMIERGLSSKQIRKIGMNFEILFFEK